MTEPEEYRDAEKRAQKLSADMAELMLRHPSSRWILRPIYRMVKWVERSADERLKEDGWR
jgi:hypothetical protein